MYDNIQRNLLYISILDIYSWSISLTVKNKKNIF